MPGAFVQITQESDNNYNNNNSNSNNNSSRNSSGNNNNNNKKLKLKPNRVKQTGPKSRQHASNNGQKLS